MLRHGLRRVGSTRGGLAVASRHWHVHAGAQALSDGLDAILVEQQVDPAFPAAVQEAAERAAAAPRLPSLDRTDLPFLTIDPASAMDLDQALYLVRDGDGFVVHYAIADVAAFVAAGDPVDVEARRRGESLYGADRKVPLHPPALSEASASLLPDQVGPAFVWTHRLDAAGVVTSSTVERALVRSRERWAYDQAQQALDAGTAPESIVLLAEVGRLREAQEAARGGISLPMPEQEVDCAVTPWRLEFRAVLPIEGWNAQISLMTGFAAAQMMLEGKVGLLRTLPPASEEAVRRLRRTARALEISWPEDVDYPAFIRSLDPTQPAHLAMVTASTSLLRGAAYVAFDGDLPEQPIHAALASPYAHVTAPLRRLCDRFALEVCAALCAGQPIPDWARSALGSLPDLMRESGRRARAYERAVMDLLEAASLAGRVGDVFTGVIVEADEDEGRRGEVMVRDAAILAVVESAVRLPVGEEVPVRLVDADPARRSVRFRYEPSGA